VPCYKCGSPLVSHWIYCPICGKKVIHRQRRPIVPPMPRAPRDVLEETLKTLTPREEAVLKLRWGWDKDSMSFEQIGQCFRLTRERIRQIQAKALRKLRHHSRLKLMGLSSPPEF